MFRKACTLFALIAVLGFAAACGDDDDVGNNNTNNNNTNNNNTNNNNTNNNNTNNNNTNNNNTNNNNTNNNNTNNNNTNNNNNNTSKDGGVTMMDGGATPQKAKSNSGDLCGGANKVQCKSTDEVCLSFDKNATNSMCLGKCVPNPNNASDPANVCPVKDTNNQMALCTASYTDQSGTKQYACLFYCSVTQSGTTKTYKCPDDKNFDCKALNASNPNVKMCVPK